MISPQYRRTKVFISYSHNNREWLARLQVHLKPMERDGVIERWDDTMIEAGSKWLEEIRKAIELTMVAVLLVSADFLASDFIVTNELLQLLTAAKQEGAVILPIIVSPSRFMQTKKLSQFQAVNSPSEPLTSMTYSEQENVFVQVTEAIERALQLKTGEWPK